MLWGYMLFQKHLCAVSPVLQHRDIKGFSWVVFAHTFSVVYVQNRRQRQKQHRKEEEQTECRTSSLGGVPISDCLTAKEVWLSDHWRAPDPCPGHPSRPSCPWHLVDSLCLASKSSDDSHCLTAKCPIVDRLHAQLMHILSACWDLSAAKDWVPVTLATPST